MKNKINFYLIEYAINSLLRQKMKNGSVFLIFTLLVSLVTSLFFISNSIKKELLTTVDSLPNITVQKIKGGKPYPIDINMADEISTITGVNKAVARNWGYYYFPNANTHFTLLGVDPYDKQYSNTFEQIVDSQKNIEQLELGSSFIGEGVKKILNENFFNQYINFIHYDGNIVKSPIAGVFKSDIQLQSNDMIVVSTTLAKSILGLDEYEASDIVVDVANPEEVDTVVEKIKLLDPNTKVVTSEEMKVGYLKIFDYKSGLFLTLFVIALFSFFIIVFDKSTSLTSFEKKEIGILKSLGWSVDDILKQKFYESFIISFGAYIIGVIFSLVFVYILNAPLLRDIFEGYSQLKSSFDLPFVLDIQTLMLVFFITVPLYVAATIIPSWRSATLDADEVIR